MLDNLIITIVSLIQEFVVFVGNLFYLDDDDDDDDDFIGPDLCPT